MKRAAAYARVSTNKQSDTSIETQFEVIENFARNGGLKIYKKYSDKITASGAKERPEFSQMIADAFAKKFDVILVYKYDRFIRDEIEDQRLMKELEKNGIYVVSCVEHIDTSTPAGRLQRWIISGINRFYIENLQQEIYDKTTKVAQKGYYLGGKVLYGYSVKQIRDPEATRNRKVYVINEEEAVVVRKIFEMFVNGYSYREITKYLNQKMKVKTREGKPWSSSTIFDLLHREKYAGIYTFRRGTRTNSHAHRSDIIRVEGGMPAIIDRETFEKVRARFPSMQDGYRSSRTTTQALCKGIIYCGICGSPMTVTHNKGQYVCTRWRNKRDTEYNGMSINKVDNFVIEYIKETLLSNVDFEELARGYNAEAALSDAQVKERIDELTLQKQQIQARIQNAIEAVLEGSPLAKQLQEEAGKLQDELVSVEKELNNLQKGGVIYITAESLKKKYDEYKERLNGNFEAKRSLVLELIKRVTIYKHGYIKVEPQ
jgi:site-specific DNA recombinase